MAHRFQSLILVLLAATLASARSRAVSPKAMRAQLGSQHVETAQDDASALMQRALQSIQDGDRTTAEQLLLRAIAASPSDPVANNALGNLYVSEKRYPEAMDRFETVLSTNLRDTEARRGELSSVVALALGVRTQDPEAALECLKHARQYLPDDPTLLTDLGIQAHAMKRFALANEALTAALALKPNDLTALYALARVETDQMHSKSAEEHFRAYLAVRPNDATAHYGLGHLYQMQLRTDDAIKEFKRSIELQPIQTESYYQLGQIALDAHQDAEARSMFEKTLSRSSTHGGALTGMGILAFRIKQYDSAQQYLKRATEASPDYQPAHYYLGLTLARLGQKDDAKKELKVAADLDHQQQGKGNPLPPETIP